MSRLAPLSTLLAAALVAAMAGCTLTVDTTVEPTYDTGTSDDTGSTDTGSADTSADTDSPDADPDSGNPSDTDTDVDTSTGEVNPCGGTIALTFSGGAASPGTPCGVCDDGFLVCNGINALRCTASQEPNACGGCGPLAANPGDTCGPCGTGHYTCDGDGGLTCAGATGTNACGGCDRLDGVIGTSCESDGTAGVLRCDDQDSLACSTPGTNACGGTDPLIVDEEDVEPGDPCGECADGRLVCDGDGGVECVGDVGENLCGGCGALPAPPATSCGACGTWTCDEVSKGIFCNDRGPNACGGCGALSREVGSECGSGGINVCAGPDIVVCAADAEGLNACGGVESIAGEPGEICGACGDGVTACVSPDLIECVAADGALNATNACGGCVTLFAAPGAACGTCGDGVWTCDGQDAVTCDDPGAAALNECGGCAELGAELGDACDGGFIECRGTEDIACVPTERNACGGDGVLPGDPGDECGECLVYACNGTVLECVSAAEEVDTCGDYEDNDCDGRVDELCMQYEFGADCVEHEDCDTGYCYPDDFTCDIEPAVCGDGILDCTQEACEDGNTEPDDGCDEFCRREGSTEFVWVGTSDSDFLDCDAWEPAGIPAPADSIVVDGDGDITFGSNASFDSVTLASTYTGTARSYFRLSFGVLDIQGGTWDGGDTEHTLVRLELGGGEFIAPAGDVIVTGALVYDDDSATFTRGRSRVVLRGPRVVVDADGIDLHKLTAEVTFEHNPVRVEFTANTTVNVHNDLILEGSFAHGDLVLNRGGGVGNDQWSINPLGYVSSNYVDVAHSHNIGPYPIVPADWTNRENNLGWGLVDGALLEIVQYGATTGAFDMGTQYPGEIDPFLVRLRNHGLADATGLTYSDVAEPFGYHREPFPGFLGDCGDTLAAGEECKLHLQLATRRPGMFEELLTVDYFDGATPESTSRSLLGASIYAPAKLSFPAPEMLSNGDGFGTSVSMAFDLLAVGAPGDDVEGDDVGAVHLFEPDGDDWATVRALRPTDPFEDEEEYGAAVALADDVLVVGAPAFRATGGDLAGLVFLYRDSGDDWDEEIVFEPPTPHPGARFGAAVAYESGLVAIGAPMGENDSFEPVGRAYVATYDTAWSILSPLTPVPDGDWGDEFGASIAACDGRVFVGAPGSETVHAYVNSGGTWQHTQTLMVPEGSDTEFGVSVACHNDLLAVGAPQAEPGDADGAVYVYRNIDSSFEPEATLSRPDTATGEMFGTSVAVADDVVIVGAPRSSISSDAGGAAFVFRVVNERWVEHSAIDPEDSLASGDELGSSVTIFLDDAAAGAPGRASGGVVFGAELDAE